MVTKKELLEAADLYEGAMGVPPQHVLEAGDAVLIETGILGGHENYPNGFVSILMGRTPEGWTIFDTGQALRGVRAKAPEGVLRHGSMMYLKTGATREQAQKGVSTLVGAIREITRSRAGSTK